VCSHILFKIQRTKQQLFPFEFVETIYKNEREREREREEKYNNNMNK
jgi:hypothetical protein